MIGASATADSAGLGRRVLLVDDELVQLKLNALRLTEAGFLVDTASSGTEALEAALRVRPDLVLADVLMRDMDGFTLCQQLRRDEALRGVPVVLASAHFHEVVDSKLAAAAGASALVARTPDFQAELDAVLRTLAAGPPTLESASRITPELTLRRVTAKLTELVAQSSAAEARYRTLLEHANDGISLIDASGVIRETNRRMSEIFQMPREEMIGRHVREFAPTGEEEAMADSYRDNLAAGATQLPLCLRRGDGTLIYVELSSTALELDGQTMMLSIGRDVTESIEAKRKLEASEQKYRSLIENIPDVIWSATLDGALTFMSGNAMAVFGFAALELTSGPARADQVHPDDRERVGVAMRDLMERGLAFDLEYRFRRKDGVVIWIHNRARRLVDARGVGHIEGVCSDITNRKRLEAEVQQSQKMEAIGQLTAGVAHDFNNILGAILANADFLGEDLGDQDPRREEVEEIKTAAARAASLTRQLLAFSRRQILQPGIVDISSVVAGVERMLRRVIGEDVALVVRAEAGLGAVMADKGQLEQVIVNLAVNARDAMPTGGKLSIETRNVELAGEAAGQLLAPPGPYVQLSVADTGCGMSAETQARIFEPFFTTKPVGQGTGLGLSTCYGIVQQSGGFIRVVSELGRGTEFQVLLPRVGQPVEATTRRGPALRARATGSETILVVEDEDPLRVAVIRMLKQRGYQVLAARDGVEAEQLLIQHDGFVHLVLSDVVMPGASGPEVVRRLQELSADTRAIFMSGYTDHAALKHGMLQTGKSFIQKPFLPEALALKVREVLDG